MNRPVPAPRPAPPRALGAQERIHAVVPDSTGPMPWPRIEAAVSDRGRLSEIARYDLDNPDLRARLDTISARTCIELSMPIALVTIVLDVAQFVAGSHGLDGWIKAAEGTPVEWSFCAHAVTSGQPYIVPDTDADPVQRTNPLVTQDHIASYAGVPLVTPSGHVLGAHCVIGDTPRTFTAHELAVLERASQEVLAALRDFTTTR